MANEQKILELDLGTDKVVSKSVDLKNQIENLRDSLDKLKKSEGDNTAEIVKQEAALKKVTTEYGNNQKVLQALVTASGKSIDVKQKANLLLNEEINSMGRAKTSITEITKLRDQLNLSNAAEAKLYEQLNDKLNKNNDFMKANGSEREKNILNIGNYRESIVGAIQDTGLWSGELQSLSGVTTSLSLPFKELKKDFKEAGSLIKNSAAETEGLTGAQKAQTIATNIGTGAMRIFALALAATGIGLIIGAVVLLIGYFKTFDPLIDAIEQAFAGLGAVIRVVQQVVASFVMGLTDLGATISKIGKFLSDPIGSLKELGSEMAKAAVEAARLKAAQQDLADAQAIQSIANKRQQAEIDRLILQSKDRSKSEQERIALLEKAEKLNRDNFAKNSQLANQEYNNAIENARIKGALVEKEISDLRRLGVEYAYKLLNQGKITQEEVDMLTKAEEARIEIYSRSTSEQEKIINRQNALIEKAEAEAEARQKKAEEARKRALDNTAKLAKAELDYFLSTQGIKAKSIEEEIALAEKVRNQKLKIAQAEFNASEKTRADELKLLTDQNNIKDEFLRKQVDSVIKNAEHELNAFISANESKIDSQKFFNDLSLTQEQNRLDLLLQKQLEYEALRLQQGVINEQEYQDAIKAIQDETQLKKDEAKLTRDLAEKEKQAIDLENQRAYEDLVFQDNLAIQEQRLEQSRLQEVSAAEKNGASVDLINKKYNALKLKLQKETEMMQIQTTANTLSTVKGLLQENTTAYKAIAIAETIINTYSAIAGQLKAFSKVPIPGYAIAQAIATGAVGFAQVAKISGVKLASGGRVSGPGTGTSDSIPAMLSDGESVINAKSTSMFAPLLSAINQAGGGKAFATGGFATTSGVSNAVNSLSSSVGLDYDLLASKISQANLNLPTPILPIQDFRSAEQSYIQVTEGANH